MTLVRRICALLVAALLTGTMIATAVPASANATTLVGAWSKDWAWFDANVGPVQIYRGYDTGWHYATWTATAAYKSHPTAPANDYSFNLPPAQLADVTNAAVQNEVTNFVATTPLNIVLTNYHEPEQEIEAGMFTAADFRAAIIRLKQIVGAQNALDGGTRRVSVVLMVSTFTGFKNRNPATYWPTVATDGGTADLISADVYAKPHATGTTGVPIGYTDGVGWQAPSVLMAPVVKFATANATPWAVSELGYLEDVNNPSRKAQALSDAVAYAKANRALFIEYWDSKGGRADWELRYNNPPVPSTSNNSNAVQAWKAAVSAP